MIQLSRNYSLPEREDDLIPIRIIGVGGGGSNVLDRMVLDGFDKSDLIAVNTDVQSLAASVASAKVQLGRTLTRGLGTGGDPEMGAQAAQESSDEIRRALTDARMIFVCAGLGGGTGSGAAPVAAQIAREHGGLVIVFATLPFTFEGKRRMQQAQDSLARLNQIADAVVCFENDRMGDIVAPKAGIHQAFAVGDMTISQSVRAIVNLIQRPGIIRIGFDDLLSALRSRSGRCLFGFGEADSDNRAHDALARALKNPLMDRGRMLADASNLLVQVAGGPGMTLSEVEILMRELGKHVGDRAQILFGTAVDGRMGNRLSVTLISSIATEDDLLVQQQFSSPAPIAEPQPPESALVSMEPEEIEPASTAEPELVVDSHATEEAVIPEEFDLMPEADIPIIDDTPKVEVLAPKVLPRQRVILPKLKPVAKELRPLSPPPVYPSPHSLPSPEKPKREKIVAAKQEVMQFEPVTRGRFEKSEPTIVEGQDLDIPTFLRKNVRVK